MLDFSTGVSPLAPPPEILAAVREADVRRYPHPTAAPLCARLAALHDVAPSQIVAGAGSVELIWALARAYAGPGRHAVVFAPSFGEYAQALSVSGARVVEVRAGSPPFLPALDAALAALASAPSLAFLCRPSNPGLGSLPPAALEALARAAPSTLFVVDEAYLPMFEGVEAISPRPNVAILRSLTKVFALPGLRLGYLVADAEVARVVQAALPPWNVSAPASAAGIAACGLGDRVVAVRREIARLRGQLADRLKSPLVTLDAQGGPFLLYRVGDAAALERTLSARGLRVRNGTSFGLPAHLRIGVRPDDEQATLAAAWHEAL